MPLASWLVLLAMCLPALVHSLVARPLPTSNQAPNMSSQVGEDSLSEDSDDDDDDDVEVWLGNSSTVLRTPIENLVSNATLHGGSPLLLFHAETGNQQLSEGEYCRAVKASNLYSPKCSSTGVGKPLDLLVSGTGRAGTVFMTKVLRHMGLSVTHDNAQGGFCRGTVGGCPGNVGAVAWPAMFNSAQCRPYKTKYMKWTWQTPKKFKNVVLMVRDPLRTISSRSDGGTWPDAGTQKWMSCEAETELRGAWGMGRIDQSIAKTMRHWVLWNTFGERTAQSVMRVEDAAQKPENIVEICKRVDPNCKTTPKDVRDIIAGFGRKTNSGHTQKTQGVTWQRLAGLDREYAGMAQKIAMQYGYDVPAHELLPEASKDMHCGFSASNRWGCHLS